MQDREWRGLLSWSLGPAISCYGQSRANRMIKAAKKIAEFKYAIRDIVASAEALEREGQDVIHLNIGDPQAFGYQPPEEIVDRIVGMARFRFTGYAHSAGLIEAREAIARHATVLGSPTDIDDVIVTSGASEAAELVLAALLNANDEVLVPAPGYPLYSAIINKLGGVPRPYFLDPQKKWQPSSEKIESMITVRTRAIVLINPNNPTGSITADKTTREILEIAERNQILVVSDEVYRELCFETSPTPASVLAKNMSVPIITLDSLSKTHMLTGWRVGWMRFTNAGLMPELVAAITRLASGRLCSPTLSQYAVKPALAMHDGYRRAFIRSIGAKRDLAVDAINSIPGLSCELPQAAFYLMVRLDIPKNPIDSEFAVSLLRKAGVLIVPGSGFGWPGFDPYFRMVFLAESSVLKKAIQRIGDFTGSLMEKTTSSPAIEDALETAIPG